MTDRKLADGWHDDLGFDDPERRLLAAVIKFAKRDALFGRPAHAEEALAYIDGRNFEADCDMLGLDPDYGRRLIQEQLATMPKKRFTDEEVRAMYDRYLAEGLTLDQVAAEYGTSNATLSRYFAMAGLLSRPRGGYQRRTKSDTGRPAANRDLETLQEINRLLVNLSVQPGRPPAGVIRVRLELDLELPIAQEAQP